MRFLIECSVLASLKAFVSAGITGFTYISLVPDLTYTLLGDC